jgi:hypothetical protein
MDKNIDVKFVDIVSNTRTTAMCVINDSKKKKIATQFQIILW